jgi:cytoskeletal protein CcmA (bactofilin family)
VDTEGIDMSIFATGKKKPGSESPTVEGKGTKSSAEPASRKDQAGISQSSAAGRPAVRKEAKGASTFNGHLRFEGTLNYTGTVTIDCHFKGSIVTDDVLVVGPSGRVDAEVTAGVVEISGQVNGNIKALTNVRILKGGKVHGNIETPKISMEEGVVFEGNCSRPADAQPPKPAPQAPPAAKRVTPVAPSSPPSATPSPSALVTKKPPSGS